MSPVGLLYNFQTTYDLRIYFGPSSTPNVGGQQPNPYVEITGNASGFIVDGSQEGKQQELAVGLTSMSLALKNVTSASSIPQRLLNLFSNTANYMNWTSNNFLTPDGEIAQVSIQLAFPDPAPEPATWLVFLATVGVGVIRHRIPSRRR